MRLTRAVLNVERPLRAFPRNGIGVACLSCEPTTPLVTGVGLAAVESMADRSFGEMINARDSLATEMLNCKDNLTSQFGQSLRLVDDYVIRVAVAFVRIARSR